MSAFFIFLLFVLNIFTIFAIIVLYFRQNRLSMLEKDQKAVIGEMEQLLSGYLMEMKEDNETLVKAINNSVAMNPEHGQKGQEHSSIKETKKEKQEIQEQNILLEYKAGSRAAAKKQAINAYKIMPEENEANVLPVKVEDKLELASAATSPQNQGKPAAKELSDMLQASLNERSLNEKVDMLADQGHSIEEIAKKLGRGRTEIELLLKFRMNR
jgi:ribosomal protein S18 acetylase RimI-like enzyme